MVKTNKLITKAFSFSDKPGLVFVKRFSRTGVNVRRFSMDGEVELDETIEDAELENEGSDAIATAVPAEEVAVFSDEAAGTDEIVAPVDGGDVTPIVDSKESEGFVEDTETAEETVDQNCGDASTAAISDTLKQFSKEGKYEVKLLTHADVSKEGFSKTKTFDDLDEAKKYAKDAQNAFGQYAVQLWKIDGLPRELSI
jgi:hypothetical protein